MNRKAVSGMMLSLLLVGMLGVVAHHFGMTTFSASTSNTTSPLWRNQGQSKSAVFQGETVLLYAQGFDENGLDYAWLETNETGVMKKKTDREKLDIIQDQNGGYATCSSPRYQSFKPTEPSITKVDLWIRGNCTWNVSITNSLTNGILTSTEIQAGSSLTTGWWSFDFMDIHVVAGNIYYIRVVNVSACQPGTFDYPCWIWSPNDVYPDGRAYPDPYSYCDFAFKTYYNQDILDMENATNWRWSNFTWQSSSIRADTTIAWRIYYSDSLGNGNVTDTMCFTITGRWEPQGWVKKIINVNCMNCFGMTPGTYLEYAVDGDYSTESQTTTQYQEENRTYVLIEYNQPYYFNNLSFFIRLGHHDTNYESKAKVWISDGDSGYTNITEILVNANNFGYTWFNRTVVAECNVKFVKFTFWFAKGLPIIGSSAEALLYIAEFQEDPRINGPVYIPGPAIFKVPDNYETIQAAIDAATVEEIVAVASGTYYEHLVVNKPIKLIGETTDTIITGNGTGTIVSVSRGYNVIISGFTLKNGVYGIDTIGSEGRHGTWNNFVIGNIITNNTQGVHIGEGVVGIRVDYTEHYDINNNFIMNNEYGVVTGSGSSNGNMLKYNNFINNTIQIQNSEVQNFDYNFWSNYNGSDTNDDGIGDTLLPHEGVDYHPLVNPWTPIVYPLASFSYYWALPTIGEEITFNATTSIDPDGEVISYQWNFGDGNITTTTNPIIHYAYSEMGRYTVTLNVTDNDGLWDSISKLLTVTAPVHDVSVTNVIPSETRVYEREIISINVTVKNEGAVSETFNVTAFYDGNAIQTQTNVTLNPNIETTLTFSWNTSGLPGNHRISAEASVVSGEIDTSDNTFVNGIVEVVTEIDIPIPSGGNATVEGNVTITKAVVTKNTLHFDASGPSWSTGWINVTFPMINTTEIKVFINKEKLTPPPFPIITSNATHYFIYFEFTLSTHEITILFGANIAITSVTPSKTVVGQNYTVFINVTVENQGDRTETFNVSVFYDDTIITLPDGKNHTTTTLTSGDSTILTLTWNTTGVAKGNYTIRAEATPVPGETDTTDNTLIDGYVIVAMVGDITGPDGWPDGKVDMRDVGSVSKRFGCNKGDLCYVPNYDINCDGKIDMKDIGVVAKHFGETDP